MDSWLTSDCLVNLITTPSIGCFVYNLSIFPKFYYVTTFGWSLVKMPSKNGWSTTTTPFKFSWYLVRMPFKFNWPRATPFEFNWLVVFMPSKFSWSSLWLRLVPSLPTWDASFKEKSCNISSNSIYWWAYALVWVVSPSWTDVVTWHVSSYMNSSTTCGISFCTNGVSKLMPIVDGINGT